MDNQETVKVFLGGTCNYSIWRNNLTKLLKSNVKCFNPQLIELEDEGNESIDFMVEEMREKEQSDFIVYVITPRMTGYYNIAEIVNDSIKNPEKVIFCFLNKDISTECFAKFSFNKEQSQSLHQIGKLVKRNGGKYFEDLTNIAYYLNRK